MTPEERELINKAKEMAKENLDLREQVYDLEGKVKKLTQERDCHSRNENLLKADLIKANRKLAALNLIIEEIKAQMQKIKENSIEVNVDNYANMMGQGAKNIKNTGEAISSIVSHYDRVKT